MTFKQAFSALGMIDKNKPLKQLSEEEEFSALANWAIQKLPNRHIMILRMKVNGEIYHTVINNSSRRLRVGRVIKLAGPGAIAYDWPEDIQYESLNVSRIEESAFRANVINIERGCEVNTAGTSRTVEEQAAENSWEIPQIRMRQTQEKCWEVILTEEEREFIE